MTKYKEDESNKLQPFQVKMLLQDVEAENLQRNEIIFLEICNANEKAYGAKGSKLRRLFQKTWSYYRGMALPKYVEALYKTNITPGEVTTRLFQQDDGVGNEEEEAEDPEVEEDVVFQDDDAGDEIEDDDHGDDDENIGADEFFVESSVETPAKFSARSFRSPARSFRTTSSSHLVPQVIPRSVQAQYSIASPTLSTCSYSDVDSTRDDLTMLRWIEDGSESRPYLVRVDIIHPERN